MVCKFSHFLKRPLECSVGTKSSPLSEDVQGGGGDDGDNSDGSDGNGSDGGGGGGVYVFSGSA